MALPVLVVVAAPAYAGGNTYHVVRVLDDRTTVVGFGCDGSAGTAPDVKLGTSPVHVRGQGSLLSRTDTLGGLMVHDPRPLRGVYYPTYAVGGTDPQAQWRVEVNGDVLTSDPVALPPDTWSYVFLEDATLHGPDDWTGSIDDYVTQFGHHGDYSAGLLAGGCLGSPEVRWDTIGTRKNGLDFEGQHWLTIKVAGTDGTNGAVLKDGQPFRLSVNAHDLAGAVGGAKLVLQKRGWDAKKWTWVATRRTDAHGLVRLDGTADKAAWWRAVWKRSGRDVPSGKALQASAATISPPAADGHRCVDDPDVFGPTCRTITVDGPFELTGTGHPARSARIHVRVHAGDISGEVIQRKVLTLGRDGWRLRIHPGSNDHLLVGVYVTSRTGDHSAGGTWEMPIVVR